MFYVALTRAERQLTLTFAMTRYQYGRSDTQELSRFVKEIDPQYLEMPKMQRQFPKVGELPRAFADIKGVKWSQETERSFKRKEDGSWSVSGYSRKGGPEFEDQLKQSQA